MWIQLIRLQFWKFVSLNILIIYSLHHFSFSIIEFWIYLTIVWNFLITRKFFALIQRLSCNFLFLSHLCAPTLAWILLEIKLDINLARKCYGNCKELIIYYHYNGVVKGYELLNTGDNFSLKRYLFWGFFMTIASCEIYWY